MSERPSFEVGRMVYDVIDCSEEGLRYEAPRRVPKVGESVGGLLRFRYGGSLEVVGEVIRASEGLVALTLGRPGIPFADILAEQRYLRGKGYSMREE